MTDDTEHIVDSASIAAASTKRRSLWRIALGNPSVIVGGLTLLMVTIIAAMAPF